MLTVCTLQDDVMRMVPHFCGNPPQISKPQSNHEKNPNWGWHSIKYLTNSPYIHQENEKPVKTETHRPGEAKGTWWFSAMKAPGLDSGR